MNPMKFAFSSSLAIKYIDAWSNSASVTYSLLDLLGPWSFVPPLFFIFSLASALQAHCGVPGASQQLVTDEWLCRGWAGPDSLGTGSVSGFGGWWLVAKAIPQGALTEQLASYWKRACVFVWKRGRRSESVCVSVSLSGIKILSSPWWTPRWPRWWAQRTEDSYGLEK